MRIRLIRSYNVQVNPDNFLVELLVQTVRVYYKLNAVMISEKTVELNLTTELINWLGRATRIPHFALAPSQRQEGTLGFDVGIGAGIRSGIGVLIQYKRAYVIGNTWRWHLNRTKMKDQHARLQALESLGYPVFYAFPYFHLPLEIRTNRYRLLRKTFWFRPSAINPLGGPVGHHDVIFDSVARRWTVHSDNPIEISDPLTYRSVADEILNRDDENLLSLIDAYNRTVLELNPNRDDGIKVSSSDELDDFDDLNKGVAVIGKHNI